MKLLLSQMLNIKWEKKKNSWQERASIQACIVICSRHTLTSVHTTEQTGLFYFVIDDLLIIDCLLSELKPLLKCFGANKSDGVTWRSDDLLSQWIRVSGGLQGQKCQTRKHKYTSGNKDTVCECERLLVQIPAAFESIFLDEYKHLDLNKMKITEEV